MSRVTTARLSDFCATGSGGTPSRSKLERYYEGGTIPWIKSGELRESVINRAEEYVTDAALKESSIKLVPAGAILLAMYGATVGRLGILGIEATTNQAVCHIVPDPTIAATRYVYHALSSQVPNLISMGVGGAQPNINQGIIKGLAIPLPPLPEQRRIAAILDQADALRAKRRGAMAQVDILTQSIFIEMFGDPNVNPRNWAIYPAENFIVSVTNGMTRRRSESEMGKDIVLRLRDVRSGWIDFSDVNRITLLPNEAQKYRVEPDDLLFIRVNGNPDYVGRCAVFNGYSEPVFFNDHIMRVKVEQSKIHRVFLSHFLSGEYGKREIAKYRKTSAGQHTINQDGLGKIEVPVPPIELQTEFAHRLEKIGKQKTAFKASLAELDALFASLQHRVFRGEL